MSPLTPTDLGSDIALQAELELWTEARDAARERLTHAMVIASLYIAAALAVGLYLLSVVGELGGETVALMSWEDEPLDMTWAKMCTWAYLGFGAAFTLFVVFTLMAIRNRLPSAICPLATSLPWVGSTLRSLSLGELCQSIYVSVLASETYPEALRRAASKVQNRSLQKWSLDSSEKLESGQSIAGVLGQIPVRDQPVTAGTVILRSETGVEHSKQFWHEATSECHELTASRLERTVQFVSGITILTATILASAALLSTVTLLRQTLQGFYLWY